MDKTDKPQIGLVTTNATDSITDIVTFINTIFTDVQEDEAVTLAQPTASGVFRHMEASDRKLRQIARKPGEYYVCTSVVKRAEKLRRRKQDCTTAYVIMLDDIGTKGDIPPVEPSIIIETSKENYQFLYLIDPYDVSTQEGRDYYEGCQRGLATAGYGDPGALEVNRIFRVPGSINTKEGRERFQTVVTHWEPERSWSLDELMEAMGVKPEIKVSARGVTCDDYDGEIVDDIEDPVLDYLQEHGRVGDFDGAFYTIPCPWAHEHTNGKDSAGYSPLGCGDMPLTRGFNCFHGHCKDRNINDFLEWLASQPEGPSVRASGVSELSVATLKRQVKALSSSQKYTLLIDSLPVVQRLKLPDIKVNDKGIPKAAQLTTRKNVQYVVDTLGIELRMNMQTRETDARFVDTTTQSMAVKPEDIRRVITDNCVVMGVGNLNEIHVILDEMSKDNAYHPLEEWFDSLEWDGKDRLPEVAGSVKVRDDYKEIWPVYLTHWLIQCVQAVKGWRKPQMMRNVLVLQGEQDVGKTTWLSKFVDVDFFKEGVQLALHGNNAKDSVINATKYPIIELGELDSTFSKSESGALKAFLSMSTDSYRAPYGRRTEEWPRCTSFCASVNRLDFLIDETGSSRFWPVEVESIDWKAQIDMAQVWAQLVHMHAQGHKWDLSIEHKVIRKEQEKHFTVVDEAEESIISYLAYHDSINTQPMTATDVARHLQINTSRANLGTIRRVLDRDLHKRRRQLKGLRNAWSFPMSVKMPSK